MSNLLYLQVGVVSGSTCFLDIGSGVGTAVLAASARHKFRKAVGIECVPELVAKSNELRGGTFISHGHHFFPKTDSFLSNLLPPSGEDGEAACESAMPEVTSNVEFIEGEAFEEITKLLEGNHLFAFNLVVFQMLRNSWIAPRHHLKSRRKRQKHPRGRVILEMMSLATKPRIKS